MNVSKIAIEWHPQMPIFASEPYLCAISPEYGWLGGRDDNGTLRCVLPFTIIRKFPLRLVRFQVETIFVSGAIDLHEERSFLEGAMQYFRSIGAHVVIPATTNTIFRTYPLDARAAPYGTYVIDLSEPETILWKNVDRITRQNINAARKDGITIRTGNAGDVDGAHSLISDTFRRSRLPFMGRDSFRRYFGGLGEGARLLVAEHEGNVQSCVLFAFSEYCAYAVYAGNVEHQRQGANKLLYWHAICEFKGLGIPRFDFVGARIAPRRGSKQEAINSLKRRFGARLISGYMWKYSLRPFHYWLYCVAAKLRSGGDIVDAEEYKLKEASLVS